MPNQRAHTVSLDPSRVFASWAAPEAQGTIVQSQRSDQTRQSAASCTRSESAGRGCGCSCPGLARRSGCSGYVHIRQA